MKQDISTHWTDDDELLEKFVLHRLPEADEKHLTAHLRDCARCQQAVDSEARIVAGIRQAGRLALKRRLRLQLAGNDEHVGTSVLGRTSAAGIPWTRIASLAAVLAIIIVVGVYNNWFGSSYHDIATPRQVNKLQPPASNEQKQESSPEMYAKRDAARTDKGINKSVTEEKSTAKVEPLAEIPKVQAAGTGKDLTKSITGGALKIERDEIGAAQGQIAEYNANLTDQSARAGEQSYWVEGRIIPGMSEEPEAVGNTPSEDIGNRVQVSAAPQADMKKKAAELHSKELLDRQVEFSLNQKPVSSLPPTLQYRQRQNAGTIQTLIENRADTVQLTLYLNSPLPDSELQTADLRTAGVDSLILTLSNQKIGYRLPPPLQGQVQTKAKVIR